MIKPFENVLLQVKCYSNNEQQDGILIVTSARVLFKCENNFAFQLVRTQLKIQKAPTEKYWALQIAQEGSKPFRFRFIGKDAE